MFIVFCTVMILYTLHILYAHHLIHHLLSFWKIFDSMEFMSVRVCGHMGVSVHVCVCFVWVCVHVLERFCLSADIFTVIYYK